MVTGVYQIRNLINNKIYIGSAVNLKNRWAVHKYTYNKSKHPNRYLQRAFNKYGISNFVFEVLEYCEKEKLIEIEQFYIDNLKPSYNLRLNAKNNLGIKFSEESKNKLRIKQSEETKIKKSLATKGIAKSQEHKIKIGLGNKKPDKWPHGCYCRCRECKDIRNSLDKRSPSYKGNVFNGL